jgi:hypothetical protein
VSEVSWKNIRYSIPPTRAPTARDAVMAQFYPNLPFEIAGDLSSDNSWGKKQGKCGLCHQFLSAPKVRMFPSPQQGIIFLNSSVTVLLAAGRGSARSQWPQNFNTIIGKLIIIVLMIISSMKVHFFLSKDNALIGLLITQFTDEY